MSEKDRLLNTNQCCIWEITNPILRVAQKRRAEVTDRLLQTYKYDRILDVGCGDGYQISYVADIPLQIVGIDISKPKLKKAKRSVQKADLICASALKLPFRPGIYNKVLCLELLEHLRSPLEATSEIDRVLKKKGILIISVPYKEQIISVQCVHCGKSTPHWGHLHSFDERKISSVLLPNYHLVKSKVICTPISSYSALFLRKRLWEFVDILSRLLPNMKPYWILSKFQKE